LFGKDEPLHRLRAAPPLSGEAKGRSLSASPERGGARRAEEFALALNI